VAEEVRNFGGSKPHRFHRIQASKAWGKWGFNQLNPWENEDLTSWIHEELG
jgi:hypothetical protein